MLESSSPTSRTEETLRNQGFFFFVLHYFSAIAGERGLLRGNGDSLLIDITNV